MTIYQEQSSIEKARALALEIARKEEALTTTAILAKLADTPQTMDPAEYPKAGSVVA